MTLDELTRVADDLGREVERFRSLTVAERRSIPMIPDQAIDAAADAVEALRIFIASAPPPDHEGLRARAFDALRAAVPLYRKQIDRVIAARPRSASN
jgi:hypothetical protein